MRFSFADVIFSFIMGIIFTFICLAYQGALK